MDKIEEFLNKHFAKLTLVILLFLLIKTCNFNSDIKSLNKRIDKSSNKIDSLEMNMVTKKDLKIEGLKAEKRMIQSTDRKMLDVTRQAKIDEELRSMESK